MTKMNDIGYIKVHTYDNRDEFKGMIVYGIFPDKIKLKPNKINSWKNKEYDKHSVFRIYTNKKIIGKYFLTDNEIWIKVLFNKKESEQHRNNNNPKDYWYETKQIIPSNQPKLVKEELNFDITINTSLTNTRFFTPRFSNEFDITMKMVEQYNINDFIKNEVNKSLSKFFNIKNLKIDIKSKKQNISKQYYYDKDTK